MTHEAVPKKAKKTKPNNITIFFGDEARTLITAGCITVYTGVSCCTLALANCTCWATWLNTV